MALTKDDLSAISQLLDSKMNSRFDVLDNRIENMEGKLAGIETTLTENVLPRIGNIETTLMENVLPRIGNIETTLTENVLPRIGNIETKIENDILPQLNDISPRLRNIELTLENDISPRMQNIESCYVTTYRRYVRGVNQIDRMQMDIDILKKVVGGHSEKLQRISC